MAKNKGSGLIWWLLILGAVALAAGAWYFISKDGDDVPQFQTATVTKGEITQAVTATGQLAPVQNVQVGSQISGIILKLYADYNTEVKSNQVVAQLDPATYQANVQSAEADLASARANLELNQAQTKRAEQLFQNKLISGSDYDTAVATLHQSEAQVKIKEASVANAKVNLSRCTIYAPVDGIVISRAVDVGQTVAASLSAPVLFTIANDLAKMQIDCNVSEADIGSVEQGQPVSFTVDAFPNRKFTGKVIQIRNSPTTLQNVVTYDTVIEVSNADLKLRPGMTANVSIIVAERGDALKVSNAALRYKPADAITNLIVAAAAEVKANATPAEPALTGNEPPEELQKRVNEMRERGEEVPQPIRDKLRGYYQSGALQRPAGGGGGGGGGRRRGGSGGGGGVMMSRTVYILEKDAKGNPTLKAAKLKTGISDGVTTEVLEGLKEGDKVVTSAILPNAAAAAPAANPFGGGGMGGPRRM